MENWGKQTLIDLKRCDSKLIKDALYIHEFAIQICNIINMKRFGDPIVKYFGCDDKVAGYSMVQLIETSLVSAHFVDATNSAYIDIFSCAEYDADKALEFSANYFKSLVHLHQIIYRE